MPSSINPHRSLVIATIGASVLVIVLPLVLWLSHARTDPEDAWEQEHHAELVQLKCDAEALAIDGKLPEAHAKYRAIQELVGGRKIKDPLIWDMLEQCKADQDRVYAVLLKKMERSVIPVVPPSSASTQPTARRVIPNYPRPYETLTAPTTTPSGGVTSVNLSESPSTRPAQPSKKQSRTPWTEGISDEQIGDAIQRGVTFLLSNFDGDELKQIDGMASPTGHHGLNALCVYALLQASQTIRDDRISVRGEAMRAMIEKMKKHRFEIAEGTQAPVVYARSMRVAALSVFNRPEDKAVMRADVEWLTKAHVVGAYSYDDQFVKLFSAAHFTDEPIDIKNILADGKHNPDGTEGDQTPQLPWSKTGPTNLQLQYPWDNSNSQFAAFAVWCGAESDVEVPVKYWQAITTHWTACQTPDGQWYYSPLQTKPALGMTVGGVSSLFIAHDWLDRGSSNIKLSPTVLVQALKNGLNYLETGDNSMQLLTPETYYVSYNLFGLERVGLVTGFKYFGVHDWYRELSARVLPVQFPNGAFGRKAEGFDSIAETAFTVLFLARGRPPVLMNKLRFDGAWGNRAHDLVGLTKFASRELERLMNWQVVPLSHDWPDWTDSPLLYIASNEAMNLTEQDVANLRGFALAGGLIFTHADEGSAVFNSFIEKKLTKSLFPEYELRDIDRNDLLYTCQYRMKAPLPKLRGIWNGARWLMVHSPQDLSGSWQARNEKSGRANFELPLNLFVYAAGKADLRNRLNSPYIPAPVATPSAGVNVIRLQYAGNWDPEPYAWTRFGRWMQWENDVALNLSTVALSELKPQSAPLAVLTGTAAFSPSDAQIAALRSFVEAGGCLLIDCCGGSADFATCVETSLLPKLAPDATFTKLAPDDPLFAEPPPYRPDTIERVGADGAKLRSLALGKGRILYSPIDITSGLLGTNTLGILGYQTGSASSLTKNVLIRSGKQSR